MNDEKQLKDNDGAGVNLGRHQSQCHVCQHPQREEIEQKWMDWWSPYDLRGQYGISHDSMYRHAHALKLFSKRGKNITAALERIIENVSCVPINGAVALSAIKAYAKINSARRGTEQARETDPMKLLEQMSKEERETFARDGSLPAWFSKAIVATGSDGQEGKNES